ncbi:MAG: hypothetical protein H7841_18365, partial [Magnetospirillum sp. WYHS-4]
DGMAAYEAKDHERALAVWLPLAEAGHAEAQYRVGRLHDEGEAVPRDEAAAAAWYRKAAEQGHEYAEAGRMFRLSAKQGEVWGQYGSGLWLAYPLDGGYPLAALAAHWFEKAAAQGLAEAQYEMGERYAWGDGKPKDAAKAIEWYRKAADQGMVRAFEAIGFVYSRSTDDRFPRDPKESLQWKFKAADVGSPFAQFSVAQALLEGKLVERDLVEGLKEDRAEARRRAEAWKPRGSWRKPLVSRPRSRWD